MPFRTLSLPAKPAQEQEVQMRQKSDSGVTIHMWWEYSARNHNLTTSKVPLKSQVQGTTLFTNAASNQREWPENSPWEV